MRDLLDPVEASAWGGFVATQARLFRSIEDNLRRNFAITHAEYEVLLRLARSRGARLRIQALAQSSLLTHSGMSRLVERLVRAGFVERVSAEEDGRGAYAALTRKGREHFKRTARSHIALVRELFLGRFSPEELEQLAALWSRLEEDGDT
ncbi:MAG: MarR family transcriptional regulator [Deltaproteobacteria bacterium]|nr:MarR family transcriptional regulator [Deltaproteobacteria bacterium]